MKVTLSQFQSVSPNKEYWKVSTICCGYIAEGTEISYYKSVKSFYLGSKEIMNYCPKCGEKTEREQGIFRSQDL